MSSSSPVIFVSFQAKINMWAAKLIFDGAILLTNFYDSEEEAEYKATVWARESNLEIHKEIFDDSI